ncbi:MAG: DNA-binding protein WhiA, partial [Bacilli bacterium]
KILNDLKVMDGYMLSSTIHPLYYEKECCLKSYIAGVFVAAGSVNAPETSKYHLEIQSSDSAYMHNLSQVLKLLNKRKYPLEIYFKQVKRRNNEVLYLKSAQEIVDFLNYIGALTSTFTFEDVRIQRDFINSLNRVNNMDLANEVKVVNAANRQLEDIMLIDRKIGLDKIEAKLREVALIRIEHPQASLIELCEVYNQHNIDKISKSGMNHRLRKITTIAKEIK